MIWEEKEGEIETHKFYDTSEHFVLFKLHNQKDKLSLNSFF